MVRIDTLFLVYTFMSNAKMKLAKNETNAEQHPELNFQLIDNFSNSSSMLSSKNNKALSKN